MKIGGGTALITGISGQDGAYLSKLLLDKGYRVIGLTRSYANKRFYNLEYLKIRKEIEFRECDLTDFSQIFKIILEYKPSEIYNLAAQSSVGLSFAQPIGTIQFNIISVLNLLEAIKILNAEIKFYQASSSEMFGQVPQLPIRENSIINPVSPYAISKASAHWIAKNYRESYGLNASAGILFNHESYLRSEVFFLKKVIRQSIRIKYNQQDFLEVGNIEVKRDFGYAPKYVEAMWLMQQQEQSDDFIICSGTSVSLRSIIEHVFQSLNISMDKVRVNEALFRPNEIPDIYGDNSKAKRVLDWSYTMSFYDVIDLILEEELRNYSTQE